MLLLMKKYALLLMSFAVLFGCKKAAFILEAPGFTNLVHVESGLYVHREIELRVDARRLESPPDDAAPGAASALSAHRFFPAGAGSASFIPSEFERRGDDLVWREVTHVSDDDLRGTTARGAQIRWEKDGAVTVPDTLEIFELPPPDVGQIDNWSPWFEAGSRREGVFGWHAEANRHAAETVSAPAYPFRMRFRLVLSKKMYP